MHLQELQCYRDQSQQEENTADDGTDTEDPAVHDDTDEADDAGNAV